MLKHKKIFKVSRIILLSCVLCILCGDRVYAKEPTEVSPVYTLVAGGDVMLGRRTAKNIQKLGDGDATYPWQYIATAFQDADIAFVNLEGVASFRGTPLDKRYTFRFDPDYIEGLVYSGIDVVSLANNHALDYGYVALCDSYNTIFRLGIVPIGAGCNSVDATSAYIHELPDGTQVAFIAMTEFYQGNTATKSRPGFSTFSIDGAIAQSMRLKEIGDADIVVVSVHAGVEHQFTPGKRITDMYHKLIDGGVDVVLGHHPHVPQPIEHYNDGYIAYSLGNLIFDMHDAIPHTKKQMLAKVLIQNGRVVGMRKIPIEMNDQFQPILVSEKGVKKVR